MNGPQDNAKAFALSCGPFIPEGHLCLPMDRLLSDGLDDTQ